jgi:hypothetical protein
VAACRLMIFVCDWCRTRPEGNPEPTQRCVLVGDSRLRALIFQISFSLCGLVCIVVARAPCRHQCDLRCPGSRPHRPRHRRRRPQVRPCYVATCLGSRGRRRRYLRAAARRLESPRLARFLHRDEVVVNLLGVARPLGGGPMGRQPLGEQQLDCGA